MIGALTLSRYIAKLFFVAIVTTMAVCTLLIFMIDFVELLRLSGKYGSVPGGTLVRIALLRLPGFVEFLIEFAVLVGSISALVYLNRKSELAVMRAGGMSVWQFLMPGILVGLAIGLFAMMVFNPLASNGRAKSDKLFAKAFGNETNLLRAQGGGSWIRQDGADGESILGAAAASNQGLTLTGVMIIAYDRDGRFSERIDAGRAELKGGYWALKDAWVSRLGQEPEKFGSYLVSTYLTPDRVQDALGNVFSISFWDLPSLIEDADKAKLSTERLRVQYETLLARPVLCLVAFGGNCVIAVIPLWGHPSSGHDRDDGGVICLLVLGNRDKLASPNSRLRGWPRGCRWSWSWSSQRRCCCTRRTVE